ncbi:peptidoglycan DD-metalloendopeptidase family protein [Marinobacter sp. M1N3S26]|uniref:peptidoglycan DD-metalloendopeptidase family protein n=1 Tax=unclassified Marinobacter TaxID=83889 RepID=UPI00387AF66F
MAKKLSLSAHQKILLLLGVLILGVGVSGLPEHAAALFGKQAEISDPPPATTQEAPEEALPIIPLVKVPEPDPIETYRIRDGDTLSDIFDDREIPASDLHKLLVADAEFLSLETLHPGKELTFEFDENENLEKLTLHLDPAREVVFDRQPDGEFAHRQIEAETYWSHEVRSGTIQRSFYYSGMEAGMSERQVDELGRLLKKKIDFRREIRKGDPFSVLIANEMTGDQRTGRYRIEAVTLSAGGHETNAFLYTDGNYYDDRGESILPAFRRWPTSRHYRVSSPFDPGRLHPITGRVSPHNGVDLATPVGTTVLSTGDGVVTRVGDHPYAGKYVDIRHNGSLSTRYLHLSRVLVNKGQRIKRGQEIARSGNTGRSTGPHLHFEFRVDGRPVDPMTADIPTAAQVPDDAIEAFDALVRKRMALMQAPESSDPPMIHAQSVEMNGSGES